MSSHRILRRTLTLNRGLEGVNGEQLAERYLCYYYCCCLHSSWTGRVGATEASISFTTHLLHSLPHHSTQNEPRRTYVRNKCSISFSFFFFAFLNPPLFYNSVSPITASSRAKRYQQSRSISHGFARVLSYRNELNNVSRYVSAWVNLEMLSGQILYLEPASNSKYIPSFNKKHIAQGHIHYTHSTTSLLHSNQAQALLLISIS